MFQISSTSNTERVEQVSLIVFFLSLASIYWKNHTCKLISYWSIPTASITMIDNQSYLLIQRVGYIITFRDSL